MSWIISRIGKKSLLHFEQGERKQFEFECCLNFNFLSFYLSSFSFWWEKIDVVERASGHVNFTFKNNIQTFCMGFSTGSSGDWARTWTGEVYSHYILHRSGWKISLKTVVHAHFFLPPILANQSTLSNNQQTFHFLPFNCQSDSEQLATSPPATILSNTTGTRATSNDVTEDSNMKTKVCLSANCLPNGKGLQKLLLWRTQLNKELNGNLNQSLNLLPSEFRIIKLFQDAVNHQSN